MKDDILEAFVLREHVLNDIASTMTEMQDKVSLLEVTIVHYKKHYEYYRNILVSLGVINSEGELVVKDQQDKPAEIIKELNKIIIALVKELKQRKE